MVQFLLEMLRGDLDLTLRQLTDMLEGHSGVGVLVQRVKNHVDAACFMLNQMHKEPQYKNTLLNKEKCRDYLVQLQDEHGLVYFETRFGSNRYANTNEFITKLLRHVHLERELLLSDVVLVLDNAPFHCRAEQVIETLLRLDPYSPILTPVENDSRHLSHR
ncbi:hypothetical protein PHMEG_00037603 [Phytophthora megakarya]|uniref:Tc1-like transposase DDE domain-containing protein n=1 Tax=Phytophthora megakarya TaxID=4795 RepID=A0A225UJF3_9STRA|nr:hypothetical protein PHMEG_00037603 [Phytophthora megakarya]